MSIESPIEGTPDSTTPAIERVTETLGGHAVVAHLTGIGTEVRRPAFRIEVPADIHELIEHGLTETNMDGGGTRKCYIAGHPGLLERYLGDADVQPARQAIHTLEVLGIPVTPTTVVEHEGEAHFITGIVDGKALDQLLPEASKELLAAVDETWAHMTKALVTAYQTGKEWPIDIEGPHQWMLGTLAGDSRPRLWMVDVPSDANSLEGGDAYGYQVLDVMTALYDIEQLSGARLPETRLALSQAIALCPDSALRGDAIRNAAYYALLHDIDPHTFEMNPDFIASMRRN